MTESLDRALDEREKLTKAYRAAKKAQFETAFEREPNLRIFRDVIRKLGFSDAEELITSVRKAHHCWLRHADPETLALALELVDRRIIQIRIRTGLPPIDDALPGEPDDVFQICKRILT